MSAGNTIKARRLRSRKINTQGDLAALLKPPVSQARISRWERDLASPNVSQCKQLARILGGKLDDYCNGSS
jgi:DNA-binding XRE family transcriptional regulator